MAEEAGSPPRKPTAAGRPSYRNSAMTKWLLSLSLLALGASAGVTYVDHLDTRLAQLEGKRPASATRVVELSRELAGVRVALGESQATLTCYAEESALREALQARIQELETELLQTRELLVLQSQELAGVEQRQNLLVRETLGEELADLNENLEERWQDVSRTLEATAQIAETNRSHFDDLLQDLQESRSATNASAPSGFDDPEILWRDLMGPTVQIADEATVGSGVLLHSEEIAPGRFRTYLLTAWHVVRDVLEDPSEFDELVPVFLYDQAGDRKQEWARVVVQDARLDSALLVMDSDDRYPHGAGLPLRAELSAQRVFDDIYAVGCPLGNDPIPTYGKIADLRHEVDGQDYWMISAPTYIGNSGGGVFDADSHELLGIFSKIYTHGNLRPTVVPHMGLVTPLGSIYDWLEESGYGNVLPR